MGSGVVEQRWTEEGSMRYSVALDTSKGLHGAIQRAAPSGAERFRRTRDAHARERNEDYAELIHDLGRVGDRVRVVDLARRLGVSHVTVVRALAGMRRIGLVTAPKGGGIALSPAGRRLAAAARRRHRIVLDLLIGLGVPPRVAEVDAEGIEHHVSPVTLRAMARSVRVESIGSRRSAKRETAGRRPS
mgnify:CR=1 FL=1